MLSQPLAAAIAVAVTLLPALLAVFGRLLRPKESGIPVTIAKDSGKPVNAASILGVIALAVEHGDYVTLTADGDGAEQVLDSLTELLTTDHDQEAAG